VCVNFSIVQAKARALAPMMAAGGTLGMVVGEGRVELDAPFIRITGLVLIALALVNLAMAYHNQLKRGF
jgi:hypothetical protein